MYTQRRPRYESITLEHGKGGYDTLEINQLVTMCRLSQSQSRDTETLGNTLLFDT